MNQFDVLGMQVHTQTHTNTHTFLCKGNSCFQLTLCLALLQQMLGIASSSSVKSLIALALEQLLDLHPQLCQPGRGSALLLLLGATSQGLGAGGSLGVLVPQGGGTPGPVAGLW